MILQRKKLRLSEVIPLALSHDASRYQYRDLNPVYLTPKPRVRLLSIVKLPWRKLRSYIPENKSQVSLDLGSLCTSGTKRQAGPHQWLEGPFSPPSESQGQQVVACFVQVGLRFPGAEGSLTWNCTQPGSQESGATGEQELFMPETHASRWGQKSHSLF